MLRLLKTLSRNKLFYVFAFLIVLMFPSTLYLQSDKDKTVVITTVGIDKEDDEYNISLLAIIPKGSNDINANLEVFEAKGKSVAEALDNLALNSGKKIGLAHCDCIIFSLDVAKNNVATILDYFIRTANLTSNATLVATDGKSKDLINATKSSNNLLDLSLKNIVMFQEENSLLENVTIQKFYRNYFTEVSTFYVPIISSEKPKQEDKQSSSGGSGSEGNEPGDSSGGSGGSSGGEQQQGKIKNENRILVLKNGKLSRELNDDEKFIYNLLSSNSENLRLTIEDVNDQYVNNSTEIFQQVDKQIIPWYSFKEGKPIATYNIVWSIMMDEIISEDNFHYASIDGLQNFLSDTVKELIHKQINQKLESTTKLMKEYKTDVLGLYTKFNAFCNKNWKEYLGTLEDPEEYLQGIDIKINLSLNYVI